MDTKISSNLLDNPRIKDALTPPDRKPKPIRCNSCRSIVEYGQLNHEGFCRDCSVVVWQHFGHRRYA